MIDASVITGSGTLSAQQQQQADAFLAAVREGLGSADTQARERARDRVLETLSGSDVSVAYRNLLSRALGPQLDTMTKGRDTHAAINALRLAGEIATRPSSETIEAGMAHEASAVRLAAAYALGRTVLAATRSAPALSASRVGELVERVGGMVRSDSDPMVVDACVRTLELAGAMTREGFDSLRDPAYAALALGVADRVRSAGPEAPSGPERAAWLRASEACRNALLEQRGLRNQARPAAAMLSGSLLKHAAIHADDLRGGEAEPAARALTQLVAAAENTILLMHPAAQGEPTLSELARRGRSAEFVAGVEAMLATSGPLVGPPFALGVDAFAWN